MNSYNALLPVLADPARFRIVSLLQQGEASVGAITKAAGIAQSGVSRHLSILHQAGVVSVRAEGQSRFYALRPEPFTGLESWLAGFHDLWAARLDRFADALTDRHLQKGPDDD